MRLTDLHPRWLSPNVLCFDCPKCNNGRDRVTIKSIVLTTKQQWQLFDEAGEDVNFVHPCNAATCWTFTNAHDFALVSAVPSLDIKGHWHGFVTNGEVTNA